MAYHRTTPSHRQAPYIAESDGNSNPLGSYGGTTSSQPTYPPSFGDSSAHLNQHVDGYGNDLSQARFSQSSDAPIVRDASNPFSANHKGSRWGVRTWVTIAVVVLVVIGVVVGIVVWQEDKAKDGSGTSAASKNSTASSSSSNALQCECDSFTRGFNYLITRSIV